LDYAKWVILLPSCTLSNVRLGKYVNLAVEAKNVVDKMRVGDKAGANNDLLALYSALPLREDYKDNGREEYAEIFDCVAHSRKRKSPDTEILNTKFRTLSKPPPPKSAPARNVDPENDDDVFGPTASRSGGRNMGYDGVFDDDEDDLTVNDSVSSGHIYR
jgi:hypothetical protein